jgi:glycosyltransferase involved in cell wall biosynthesis
MRLAHVFSSSISGSEFAGIEAHILSLAAAQKTRGHIPAVIADQPRYFTEACQRHDIPVVIEPAVALARGRGVEDEAQAAIGSLAHRIKELGADLVHSHAVASIRTIPAADGAGVPCVHTHHMAGRPPGNRGWARALSKKFAIICVSRESIAQLKESGLPEEDLFYVPNGTKVIPAPPVQTAMPRRPGLLLVGRLDRVKGADVAILATAALHRRLASDCPPLDIYGTGQDERYLKEMVAALRLEGVVRFHGNRPQILDTCPVSNILLVPSRSETGPIVALEAMSRGIPIVATNVGQIGEMLPDDRYGRVVPVESITRFADAIEGMLADIASGQFEPTVLIERHRSSFTDTIMAERTDVVYEWVLGKE